MKKKPAIFSFEQPHSCVTAWMQKVQQALKQFFQVALDQARSSAQALNIAQLAKLTKFSTIDGFDSDI